MKTRFAIAGLLLVLIAIAGTGYAYFKKNRRTADEMTVAAGQLLVSLSEEERAIAQLDYDTPQRLGWHFIPKNERKGLQIKNMSVEQRELAHGLLRSTLSKAGYDKSTTIMQLEAVLHAMEAKKGGGGNIRDPLRYYVTIFGTPSRDGRWGLSFEGHHLSLNFVIDGDQIISSTPQFMATNPAIVRGDYLEAVKKDTRVLAKEETLAFQLVRSLSDQQRGTALLAPIAPREIRNAGEPQPAQTPAEGLAAADMTEQQTGVLKELIEEYLSAMPMDVAGQRRARIEAAGFGKIKFAWAGATDPGIGHYYRVQGPSFLIEFVNTQPDPAGNPANHVHCVWRDPSGDFAVPVSG